MSGLSGSLEVLLAKAYADIDLAPFIDHTLLVVTATPQHIAKWCDEAERFKFASVCVAPVHVPQAVELLRTSNTLVSTVIGFPTGATTSAVKLYEAQEAIDRGAAELDVVINLGWLKQGMLDDVHRDLAAICDQGHPVKAIVETPLLTEAEKQIVVDICVDAGAAFVKTCTGWNGGVTVADVALLKAAAKDRVAIKASGGIRTTEQAMDMVLAGASRLGTSYGAAIMNPPDMLEEEEGHEVDEPQD
ncbi:MAG: deoxyribose-phosphate aldolase [Kaiparowitsia implicata GSE-PSE-MK54-09C]|jgi:deoxyribose-phosphate aldolase|nr:deoxyribose-phosphate aldolase [Kaiparowitsia implicata GSE-PSE-MK54-09C]